MKFLQFVNGSFDESDSWRGEDPPRNSTLGRAETCLEHGHQSIEQFLQSEFQIPSDMCKAITYAIALSSEQSGLYTKTMSLDKN